MSKPLEKVGQGISTLNAGWKFDAAVVENFDDHVVQSIPFYLEGHDLICKVTDYFVKDDSVAYDLGASTGSLLLKLVDHHKHKPDVRWIGIDTEPSMVEKAKKPLKKFKNVEMRVDDVTTMEFEGADLIIAYYTVQFVHPKHRQILIDNIFNALNWGGAFIWFEKVRASDARFQDIMTTLYHDFKLGNGFSPEEVISKSRSLKGVLEPFSTNGNLDLLKRAGFVDSISIMKYLCFEGILAIK